MDNEVREKERELDKMSLEDEMTSKELSIAQKKALIREAKAKYGHDWKKVLGMVGKSIHVNSENMQTLYSQGLGDLRDLSDPRVRR